MKINVSNSAKLSDAINAAEHGCKVRLLNKEIIPDAIKKAERRLEEMLYKKDWTGITITIDSAGGEHFPGSYKGVPESTHVTFTRGPSSWFLTGVCRARVSSFAIKISERSIDEKAEAVLRYLKNSRSGL